MKVYVVYNEALHSQSSYHHISGVFKSAEGALTCIGSEEHDFIRDCDKGEYPDFADYKCNYEDKSWECIIETPMGYYEAWKIIEQDLED